MTPPLAGLKTHGAEMRRAVRRECRSPVCVGIAPTLTLAKIANQAAKNYISTMAFASSIMTLND